MFKTTQSIDNPWENDRDHEEDGIEETTERMSPNEQNGSVQASTPGPGTNPQHLKHQRLNNHRYLQNVRKSTGSGKCQKPRQIKYNTSNQCCVIFS